MMDDTHFPLVIFVRALSMLWLFVEMCHGARRPFARDLNHSFVAAFLARLAKKKLAPLDRLPLLIVSPFLLPLWCPTSRPQKSKTPGLRLFGRATKKTSLGVQLLMVICTGVGKSSGNFSLAALPCEPPLCSWSLGQAQQVVLPLHPQMVFVYSRHS